MARDARSATIRQPTLLNEYLRTHDLHPALRSRITSPDTERDTDIASLILEARSIIVTSFAKIEKDIGTLSVRGHCVVEGLHSALGRIFLDARFCVLCVKARGWDVRLRPLIDEYLNLSRWERFAGIVNLPDSPSTSLTESKSNKHNVPATTAGLSGARSVTVRNPTTTRKHPSEVETEEIEESSKAPRKANRRRKEDFSVHDVNVKNDPPEGIQTRSTRRRAGAPPLHPPSAHTLRQRVQPTELPHSRPSRTRRASVRTIQPAAHRDDVPRVPRTGHRTVSRK